MTREGRREWEYGGVQPHRKLAKWSYERPAHIENLKKKVLKSATLYHFENMLGL